MMKRAILLVSGDVQEVGYRETVHEIAFDMHLTGQVRNLENGNVEVIVEGEEGLLRQFAKKIHFREFPVEVRRIRKQFTRPTGQFKKFTVVPDERLDKDMNAKIEHGFRYFKIMRKDISGSIKKMDSNMGKRLDRSNQKQGLTIKAIKGMGANIKSMDTHMGRRFDRLDSKYGEFGRTMKGMARDTRKSGKDVRATGGHIKTMATDMKGVKGAITGMASDIKAIRNATTAPRTRKAPIPA